ncbi:TPA: ogr/Delta-like zinc finger family protein, partial [Pseudomonas aeruginosa]|nr:ogr/Delta-like zinc finger family protein [Pseudomonas aeruginosa]
MSVYKLVCPCCHSRMRIRSSEGQTPCFRSMYAQCTNALCGATFTGSLSWDYQLSPS